MRLAKIAEGKEFYSVWHAEHFLFRDALSMLTAIAATTSRIKIATGVISPYTRNPALLAMSIATLNEISAGRFLLGIGTNARFWKMLGINDKSPMKTLADSVTLLRQLLSDQKVTYESPFMRIHDAKLDFQNRTMIPIYLGALGPKLLEMAGRIGDGVVLSAGSSANYVKYAVEKTKAGLSKSSRSVKEFDFASFIISWLADEPGTEARVKEWVAAFLSVPGREIMLGDKELYKDELNLMRKLYWSGDLKRAGENTPSELVDLLTISGDERTLHARLEEYYAAGLTHAVILPIGSNPERLIEAFAKG
jgi:5,10-methylenetetrahydromethanopterin reductase